MGSEYHEHTNLWKQRLLQGLEDDGWEWDWTTLGSISNPEKKIHARVVAKAEGIWAASGLTAAITHVSKGLGGKIQARSLVEDGARIKSGQTVCEWEGPARIVLALERPFLNLAQYVCGVATQTAQLVEQVKRACPKRTPRVTSTRKTLPGYRDVAILGIRAGGGYAHRVSLSGGILIKENHIAAAGGIRQAVEGVRKEAPHLLKIETEVRDLSELEQAIDAGTDGVMLDNFTPKLIREALDLIKRKGARIFVEVSGGLNSETISNFAIEGVDVLSVGSLSHSVKALDLSLLVTI